jgi:hypothetical protein
MRGTSCSRWSAAPAALRVIAAAAGADQLGRRAGQLLIALDLHLQACAWPGLHAAQQHRRRRTALTSYLVDFLRI